MNKLFLIAVAVMGLAGLSGCGTYRQRGYYGGYYAPGVAVYAMPPRYVGPTYVQPTYVQPTYVQQPPQQVYVQPTYVQPPPQQVYVQPQQPVYVQPQTTYVAPTTGGFRASVSVPPIINGSVRINIP